MVLIFTGFLLRSFGKGKEEGLGNEYPPKAAISFLPSGINYP